MIYLIFFYFSMNIPVHIIFYSTDLNKEPSLSFIPLYKIIIFTESFIGLPILSKYLLSSIVITLIIS